MYVYERRGRESIPYNLTTSNKLCKFTIQNINKETIQCNNTGIYTSFTYSGVQTQFKTSQKSMT